MSSTESAQHVSPPSSSPLRLQREWLAAESSEVPEGSGPSPAADALERRPSSSQWLVKSSTYVVKAASHRFSRSHKSSRPREGPEPPLPGTDERLASVPEASAAQQQRTGSDLGAGVLPLATSTNESSQYVVEERTLISVRGGGSGGRSGLLERLGRGLLARPGVVRQEFVAHGGREEVASLQGHGQEVGAQESASEVRHTHARACGGDPGHASQTPRAAAAARGDPPRAWRPTPRRAAGV